MFWKVGWCCSSGCAVGVGSNFKALSKNICLEERWHSSCGYKFLQVDLLSVDNPKAWQYGGKDVSFLVQIQYFEYLMYQKTLGGSISFILILVGYQRGFLGLSRF